MDDQFGGRTDDDLFADEFEPIADQDPQDAEAAPVPAPVANIAPSLASRSSSTAPTSIETDATPSAPAPVATIPTATDSNGAASNETAQNVTASIPPAPPHKPGLMQSRHAPQPPPSAPRAPRNHRANNPTGQVTSRAAASPSPSSPATPSSAKHETRQHKSNPGSDARTGSGANPRTKLTESELADKMEKMRILNEEKTRRFKREEKDQQSHAIAMEKATAEQRKRRREEAERRKREATDRRQMDDEREKNRQRKLNAMGARESSWDEGKEQRLQEEDQRRGTTNFRGANGGVRGPVSGRGGGMAASRFADSNPDTDFMSGRGARGGRGGRGRGGRGDYTGTPPPHGSSEATKKDPSLTNEEFPALPPSSTVKKETAPVAKTDLASPTSPLGKWDDEMAAMDAKTAAAAKS